MIAIIILQLAINGNTGKDSMMCCLGPFHDIAILLQWAWAISNSTRVLPAVLLEKKTDLQAKLFICPAISTELRKQTKISRFHSANAVHRNKTIGSNCSWHFWPSGQSAQGISFNLETWCDSKTHCDITIAHAFQQHNPYSLALPNNLFAGQAGPVAWL